MKKIIIGILATIGVLAIIAGGLLFYGIKTDYKFTGQELFDEVNKYRSSKGISTLELDPVLCDNLVERWLAVKNPDSGHKGFEEWAIGEGIADNPKYGQISELFITASNPANAVNWWVESPGHRSTLEMPSMVYGCAYANDGTGVLIMAEKRQ